MNDSWTIIGVERGPGLISDEVCNALKVAACSLHAKKCDAMRIDNDILSGIIETEWKVQALSGRSGVLFRAQVDCIDGTDYQVNFLFREDDLERGAEIIREIEEGKGIPWEHAHGEVPCPELYDFKDLLGPSRRVN